MSKHPVRATGFTRFFLVMLLIAPLAYIGASYYNGENGIENIKRFLNLDKKETSNQSGNAADNGTQSSNGDSSVQGQASKEELLRVKEELEFKNKRIEELYRENEELKRKLESAEKALEESKK